jgi:hypothetical protein
LAERSAKCGGRLPCLATDDSGQVAFVGEPGGDGNLSQVPLATGEPLERVASP